MAISKSALGQGNGHSENQRIEIPPMTPAEITQAKKAEIVVITPPRLETVTVHIRGLSPYIQHKFSEKAQAQIEAVQRAGTQARSKKKRDPKDFEAVYRSAQHRSREGWCGIPAPAFRNAAIDACRLVGYKMTHAKLSLFIEADGFDADDGTPLVRIGGEPEIHKGWGRNANGNPDLRWRPMWREGWEAFVRVRWDADQFSASDVGNLMMRAGMQCGIGEGRPSSPKSNGLGWGLFEVLPE